MNFGRRRSTVEQSFRQAPMAPVSKEEPCFARRRPWDGQACLLRAALPSMAPGALSAGLRPTALGSRVLAAARRCHQHERAPGPDLLPCPVPEFDEGKSHSGRPVRKSVCCPFLPMNTEFVCQPSLWQQDFCISSAGDFCCCCCVCLLSYGEIRYLAVEQQYAHE